METHITHARMDVRTHAHTHTHTHTHTHAYTDDRHGINFKKSGARWPQGGAHLVLKNLNIMLPNYTSASTIAI